MKTLYDLLGALPDDDAEDIRIAFRKAVKATHPDTNTSDPDSQLRFRQIVRANSILSDQAQRTTYDRLLALALRQQRTAKRSAATATIRKLAFNTIAAAFISAVSIGAYALIGHSSNAAPNPRPATEMAARGPAEIAAVAPTVPRDAAVRGGRRDRPEIAELPDEAIAPRAVAPAANTGRAPATASAALAQPVVTLDARSYRERGVSAYLHGDLPRALADLNSAIGLDPGFADAYLDRGIVLYRMQQSDRAFADIAKAKRIEDANRSKSPAQTTHKLSPSSVN
jgi:curved DNA-binding protein CbpA